RLNDPRFAVRELATKELERIGGTAIPALRKLLQGQPTLEVRRRAGGLLERLEASVPPPVQLCEIRTVAILEYAGTDEAQRLLKLFAEGTPRARLTQEAKAALKRLVKRPKARQ